MIAGRDRARPWTAQVCLLALGCLALLALTASSEDLMVRHSEGELHVLAPRLHFLSGKTLQRLRDGATVPFDFQLTLSAGTKTNVIGRALERFMVSYDVWEEKFKVVGLGNFHRYGSHLSSTSAESWCLANIFVPASSLPADKDLWARLEIRTEDAKEQASVFTDPGISIPALIGIFSHQARPQQDHWTLDSTAFRLADLKP